MLINLVVLAFLSSVHAAVATYGSESYISGADNQFDMGGALAYMNQKRSALGQDPLVYDLRLNIGTAIQCERLIDLDFLDHYNNSIFNALLLIFR